MFSNLKIKSNNNEKSVNLRLFLNRQMINIAIIGYGYWGPNLLRNFNANANCNVKYLIDGREDRLKIAKNQYPNIETVTNIESIIQDPNLHAVVIATPVFTHFELAKLALEHGKHVLIEKPMTSNSKEAQLLIEIAEKKGLLLMVDHTFLYTGAVQQIKQFIDKNEIGNLQYFDSTRINLGLIQPDVNVLWDLAPHDLSILFYLNNEKPVSVQATGVSHTKNGIENIAYLTINYQSDFIAHFNCSWSSPVKLRNILIGGDKKMILFNDIEPAEKIKIYDTGFQIKNDEDKRKLLIDYRVGDIFVPKIDQKEALQSMAEDFAQGILNKTIPISNAHKALEVVKVLEAAQLSIKNNGKEIKI
jgi:predicted dehydrogenase